MIAVSFLLVGWAIAVTTAGFALYDGYQAQKLNRQALECCKEALEGQAEFHAKWKAAEAHCKRMALIIRAYEEE